MAIRADPRIVEHIEEIMIMGGGYLVNNTTPMAEYNVWVDPEALDNIDLMEALGEIDSGNVFYIAKALRLMLGDQWARVKRELANDSGVTTASATAEFVGKMLTALSEANEQAKN